MSQPRKPVDPDAAPPASTFADRLRRAVDQLPYLRRALGLVWQAAPRHTASWALLLLVQGLLPVANVRLTRVVVDGLVAVAGRSAAGTAAADPLVNVILPLGLLVLVMLAGTALASLLGYVRSAQAELVRDHVSEMVHAKSAAVDLAFYDTPEYYDHMHRARAEAQFRPMNLLESAGGVVQNAVTLTAMGAVLAPYGAWLPVALLVSTAPALMVVLRGAEREHAWRDRTTADDRRAWYFDWLLTARETAAEVRIFGLSGSFQEQYRLLRRRLRSERLALVRDQGFLELGASVFGLVMTGVALWWMLKQVAAGAYSLGDLALFYQAFSQGQGLMRALLQSVGQIYANSLFLSHLFRFLDLETTTDRRFEPADFPQPPPGASLPGVPTRFGSRGASLPGVPTRFGSRGASLPGASLPGANRPTNGRLLTHALEFRDVSFRYADSNHPALDHFDLRVPAGQIAAVVGTNGAGKSTLVKLLCRLYDPESGAITMDGIDLRQLDPAALRREVSVLFQEPVHYNATLADNIAYGDLAALPARPAIEAAGEGAGVGTVAAELPEGYDTLLGRWFKGGTDLSVGQWQRVALGRAFLRQGSVLILDEPTSAMDSWAEADWLARFRRLAKGKTAIIITHRFTTAMQADVIHVMNGGRIVESGTHAELLAAGGFYADSWRAQTRQQEPA